MTRTTILAAGPCLTGGLHECSIKRRCSRLDPACRLLPRVNLKSVSSLSGPKAQRTRLEPHPRANVSGDTVLYREADADGSRSRRSSL